MSGKKGLNPMGTWCGVLCMYCDERFICYNSTIDIPIVEPQDDRYDETDVLEDDYTEDSVP